jgi:hypothetical protein
MAFVEISEGEFAPLITLQPNAPIVERYIYLTDIMQSTDGTESRIPLRTDARIQYDYEYPTSAITQDQRMFNVMFGGLRKKFAVPVWHQAVRLAVEAEGEATSITLAESPAFIDIRRGDFVLVWRSATNFEVLKDVTISGNVVSFEAPLTKEFYVGDTWVMPIRIAYVLDDAQKSTAGISSKWLVSFEVLDEIIIEPDTPPEVAGLDVYLQDTHKSGRDSLTTISAEIDRVDFQLGKFFKRTTWKNSYAASNDYLVMESKEEVHNLKRRFRRHYGRNRAFWSISHAMNIRIKSASGNKIVIHPDDYFYYQQHKSLVFTLFSTSEKLVRTITEVEAIDEENLELMLDSSAPDVDDVFYASYVGVYRMDSDTLTIEHAQGKSSATLRLLELGT